MASALNHPHIVTVHDAGEVDGRQYLVTEFVDGGTLARLDHRAIARPTIVVGAACRRRRWGGGSARGRHPSTVTSSRTTYL